MMHSTWHYLMGYFHPKALEKFWHDHCQSLTERIAENMTVHRNASREKGSLVEKQSSTAHHSLAFVHAFLIL